MHLLRHRRQSIVYGRARQVESPLGSPRLEPLPRLCYHVLGLNRSEASPGVQVRSNRTAFAPLARSSSSFLVNPLIMALDGYPGEGIGRLPV